MMPMPRVTRWFLKTSLLYLILALAAGAVPVATGSLLPVYLHLLVLGWVTQLIFGVAFWLFPVPSRTVPRPDERPLWAVYCLLNGGLVLRSVAEPLAAGPERTAWGAALVVSAVLLWAAGTGFAVAIWPRVKAR